MSLPQRQDGRRGRGCETTQLSWNWKRGREVSFIKARCWVHCDFRSTRRQSGKGTEQEGRDHTEDGAPYARDTMSPLTLNTLQLGTPGLKRPEGLCLTPGPLLAVSVQERHPGLLGSPPPHPVAFGLNVCFRICTLRMTSKLLPHCTLIICACVCPPAGPWAAFIHSGAFGETQALALSTWNDRLAP